MASLNRVYLMGNLTRDPEVKYLPDGTAVADMRLAVSERFRNRSSGEQVERTCFVDVVVWRAQAENCGKYLSKGSPVLVEGRLQLDEWEAQDGSKRSKLRVQARNVQFLGSPRGGGRQDDGAPRGGAAAGGDGTGASGAETSGGEPAGQTATDQGGGGATPVSPDNLGDDDNLPF